MRARDAHARWWRSTLLIAAGVFLGSSMTALTSHTFGDVPTSAFFHDAVEWIRNRGITAGCAATQYCPDSPVTRGQMAVFLQKLGTALTPTFLRATGSGGALVVRYPGMVICQTAANHTPSYAQIAIFHSVLSFNSIAQPLAIAGLVGVYSIDGGASWQEAIPGSATQLRSQSGDSIYADWKASQYYGTADLAPGQDYRFGMRIWGAETSFEMNGYYCANTIEIVNRNPPSSPLTPP